MTDSNLKQAMKFIAAVTGLTLTDDRIERDLPAFKANLAAIETIQTVELPLDAEPLPIVVLPADHRS